MYGRSRENQRTILLIVLSSQGQKSFSLSEAFFRICSIASALYRL